MTTTTKFNHRGRRCLSCHQQKAEREFPSSKALTCNFCTPVSDALSNAIMKPNAVGNTHSGTPSMRELARRNPAPSAASMSVALQRDGKPPPMRNASPLQKYYDAKALPGTYAMKLEPEPPPQDNRPLIDKLNEATFTHPIGLQWIKDKYGFRTILRKAHCFMLDDVTSGLIADFSIAIALDLESARRMAIPPFPVTWIEINNHARLQRIMESGVKLTPMASGLTHGEPCARVGWLIQPAEVGGYYATYATATDEGIMIAPLSYWWHTDAAGTCDKSNALPENTDVEIEYMQRVLFGVKECNVDPRDAAVAETPMHEDIPMRDDIYEMMVEIGGELRHIWGLLIALGAGQLGLEAKTTPHPPHDDIRQMPNGKPLLPLEHKLLHLHMGKRLTVPKVIARMITHHKHRHHEVRSHWRTLKNADGTVKKRVSVKAHERGDERLGKITKTYRVER